MNTKLDLGYIPSKYQEAIFQEIDNGTGNIFISACAGSGKCLGKDTPVLLFDGTIKNVQDVKIGDQLMGPDSTPRNVLSTTTGFGNLCKINPVKGSSWICNDVHILTLKHTVTKKISDMSVIDHIKRYKLVKNPPLKLFRVSIEFPKQDIICDPYLLGLWLGDGHRARPSITNEDVEILSFLEEIALKYNLTAKFRLYANKSKLYNINLTGTNGYKGIPKIEVKNINILRNEFKSCIDKKRNKFIPQNYLINSRENRLELLAGLLDADGHLHNKCYEILTKFKTLKDNILYLARSLGFAAYATYKKSTIKSTGFVGYYWRIKISGHTNLIPCKILRKQTEPRLQKKDVLNTGFKIENIGQGDYYGFTLDGDGRFLLGDFTVTHNTTTIVSMAEILSNKGIPPNNILFLAFNRSITETLQQKVAGKFTCKTLNSLGHSILQKKISKPLILDGKKYNTILTTALEPYTDKYTVYECMSAVSNLLNKCMGRLTEPTIENIKEVIQYYSLEFPDRINEDELLTRIIKKAMELGEEKAIEKGVIAYDDQIWLPALKGWKPPKYDYVLVDEAQDPSKAKLELALGALHKNGRFIAVADKFQSIYAFASADANSIDNIIERTQPKELPLSVSYRCPKKIIELAKKYAPHIEARPDAPEGEINYIDEEQLIKTIPNGALILCRTTQPLVAMCIKLISNKIGAKVKGRDIGANIKKTFLEIIGKKNTSLNDFPEKLAQYVNRKIDLITSKDDHEATLQTFQDKISCIEVIFESYDCQSIDDFNNAVDSLFSDEKSVVTLSTVHKIKGCEEKHVYIIAPYLLPMTRKNQKEWELVQERNLTYVAYTRAMETLTFVHKKKVK